MGLWPQRRIAAACFVVRQISAPSVYWCLVWIREGGLSPGQNSAHRSARRHPPGCKRQDGSSHALRRPGPRRRCPGRGPRRRLSRADPALRATRAHSILRDTRRSTWRDRPDTRYTSRCAELPLGRTMGVCPCNVYVRLRRLALCQTGLRRFSHRGGQVPRLAAAGPEHASQELERPPGIRIV